MPTVKITKAASGRGKQIEITAKHKGTGKQLKAVIARKDAKPVPAPVPAPSVPMNEKNTRHYLQLATRLGLVAQCYSDCRRVVVEIPFSMNLPKPFDQIAAAGHSSPSCNGFLKAGYELVVSGHMSYSLLGKVDRPELETGFSVNHPSLMVDSTIDARKVIRTYGAPHRIKVCDNIGREDALQFLLWYHRQIGWARSKPRNSTVVHASCLREEWIERLDKVWTLAMTDWPTAKAA